LRPAFSIVVFTTVSGSGYGLLFWLGLLAALGGVPDERAFAIAGVLLALAAVTTGLVASMAHLGHPERAWRAFSQWRSSWLSREGVAALATYAPALGFAAAWVWLGESSGIVAAAGLLAALGAIVTVTCTAYIYASLKPVQRWCNRWVPPNYLALAAMTGALWLAALVAVVTPLPTRIGGIALATVLIAAALKIGYWRFIDSTAGAGIGSATGLGGWGEVRLFEAPHTSENYLLKEMGFTIARKHAAKLRMIALLAAFVLPAALTLAAMMWPGWASAAAAMAAAVLAQFGVFIERWLFFAEAKHSVTLYYGAARA
jgi:DMSO reductase anchor subunit